MKKSISFVALSCAMLFASFPSRAQEFKTGYFVDNYLYAYRINPAEKPKLARSFVGLGVGNINVDASSNVGVSNFLFPYNGQLVFGLNQNVSREEFIGGLQDINTASASVNENLLVIGTCGSKGGYTTIELNVRSINNASVPRKLFELLKDGPDGNGNYSISDVYVKTRNWAELAVGYSTPLLGDRLRIGARAKALLGLANVSVDIRKMNLNVNTNTKVATVSDAAGSIKIEAPAVSFQNTNEGNLDIQTAQFAGIKPSGLGFSVDFGGTFEIFKGFTVGASVRDLGFLKWKKTAESDLKNINGEYDVNDLKTENIVNILKLKSSDDQSNTTEMLPMTINASVKYTPFDLISVGLLGTFVSNGEFSTREIRAIAAINPFRFVNVGASYALNSMGNGFGAVVSLDLAGIHIFAGLDQIFTRVTPQFIPIEPINTTVSAGIALAFGSSRGNK